MEEMRLALANINWSPTTKTPPGIRHLKLIMDILKYSPEVIALQEYFFRNPELEKILEERNYNIYLHNGKLFGLEKSRFVAGGLCISLNSKIEILEHTFTPFNKQGNWHSPQFINNISPKGLQILNTPYFTLINTHTSSHHHPEYRKNIPLESQISEIIEVVCLTTNPLILVGDLNIKPDWPYYQKLINSGLIDLSENLETFPPENSQRDYFFVNQSFFKLFPKTTFQTEIIRLSPELSDHNGLLLSFKTNN